jgi:hypothetical protein
MCPPEIAASRAPWEVLDHLVRRHGVSLTDRPDGSNLLRIAVESDNHGVVSYILDDPRRYTRAQLYSARDYAFTGLKRHEWRVPTGDERGDALDCAGLLYDRAEALDRVSAAEQGLSSAKRFLESVESRYGTKRRRLRE